VWLKNVQFSALITVSKVVFGVVMSISGVLQTGIQGIQSGVQGMERAASEIARVSTDSGVNDIIEPVMDLKLYELSVKASAKVVQTADEVLGTLMDTMA
jgi:flagellar hook-associated protein FlgK